MDSVPIISTCRELRSHWKMRLVIVLASYLITLPAKAQYKYPFWDPDLPWNDRVDDLVGRLTLEEMVTQTMIKLRASPGTPGIERLGVKPYVWSTECLRGHVRQYATAFPQSLGLAATFR